MPTHDLETLTRGRRVEALYDLRVEALYVSGAVDTSQTRCLPASRRLFARQRQPILLGSLGPRRSV